MADRPDFIKARNHSAVALGQNSFYLLERHGMVRHFNVKVEFAPIRCVAVHMAACADALADSLRQHIFPIHINQLIFQGRASRIDDQDFHSTIPPLKQK